MDKWKSEGLHVRRADGYVCQAHTTVLAAQIEREHNSYDALVQTLNDAGSFLLCNFRATVGKARMIKKIEAALALAEVKP